jgi:predicted nucleic acid-binding protein
VLAEYRSVLYRQELDLHEARRRELLGHLSALSLHVAPTEKLAIAVHEPDNRFYECAHASAAHYLVTGNRKHFPKELPTTKIVTARQLLDLMGDG